jgi:DNA-binding NtrC family response regulator
MAASNLDLREMVAAGRFREDLLHRLDLFRLQLPPLRERATDILPLAETLLTRACRRHRLDPRPITEEGRRRLAAWPWPGNVRELTHEIERALVFEDGPLNFTHLERFASCRPSAASLPAGEWFNPAFKFPDGGFNLEAAIDRIVDHALGQTGGNVSAAARLLGVSRDVVRYRIAGRSSPAAPGGE